jgi:hypothetical protein
MRFEIVGPNITIGKRHLPFQSFSTSRRTDEHLTDNYTQRPLRCALLMLRRLSGNCPFMLFSAYDWEFKLANTANVGSGPQLDTQPPAFMGTMLAPGIFRPEDTGL